MGASSLFFLFVVHPLEFLTLLRFKLFHSPKRDITAPSEHVYTGWDHQTMRRCWEFLDMKSKTIGSVIKQIEGDTARIVCIFYIILRALDTIEDDMTIPEEQKQTLLRSFDEFAMLPGWTFTESSPKEKLRQMLVEFNVIHEELVRLDEPYREIILDITRKMGNGMADYCQRAGVTGQLYIETIADFDLYCHYVAGLVGEGMTCIFAQSGKEAPWLRQQLALANSMGLFLQKIDIIRDYREDIEEDRFYWPKEIWGRQVYGKAVGRPAFNKMEEMYQRGNERQALWVLSGMIVDALRHAIDALDYLHLLQRQSVFNFCAFPQVVDIARLYVCYMNSEVFHGTTNIRKGEAASLVMRSTSPRDVACVFREYACKLRKKANLEDPNYVDLVIELWCEHYYPPNAPAPQPALDGAVPLIFESGSRTRLLELERKAERDDMLEARAREIVTIGQGRSYDIRGRDSAALPSQSVEWNEARKYGEWERTKHVWRAWFNDIACSHKDIMTNFTYVTNNSSVTIRVRYDQGPTHDIDPGKEDHDEYWVHTAEGILVDVPGHSGPRKHFTLGNGRSAIVQDGNPHVLEVWRAQASDHSKREHLVGDLQYQ
ncbi:uncharacterized protein FIBRA_05564 [Fibroporia radiculosa]|uniref:Squalene synthase n=1 Tax=Fibroporia radiculosa TaxID=599839 RepID=J4IAS7_9APHY|nr:uncharacterized protein FIBRA_05564 [Fibroporia radiculosa]CCM03431.1 predicted protein [Fibroporia radiculosa]